MTDKHEAWLEVKRRIQALIGGEQDEIAVMATVAAELRRSFAWFNWVGFYRVVQPAVLKVGPYHSTITFLSHPHGNQFLNSPHGKFTGNFAQIPTGKFNFAMTGLYKSFFQIEAEAANTGNGCTGCHDVHASTVTADQATFREECTVCHQKNLGSLQHPSGAGTPLEAIAEDPMEPCVVCHMPDGLHLFRINADAAYSTFPSSALTATSNANTAPDGDYTQAVWVDLDHACGQCHGGGLAEASTTGSINAGSATLTNVADTTGFIVGQRVRVAGAGSLYYDDEGQGKNEDLESYVKTVTPPNTIVLNGNATKSVTGAAVEQNPTKNGAGYLTKAELAPLAEGIHNDAPVVSFGYTLGSPNTLQANFFASATCGGPCDAYEWDFGDGSTGTGVSAMHVYASAGTYVVTLTVERFGVNSATTTRNVTVYQPDLQPTAAGVSCTVDGNWMVSFTDASTDDNAVGLVTVKWGDGSLLATGGQGSPFSHTYRGPGNYNVVHKAVDNIGQQKIETCVATVSYFTISGTVTAQDNTVIPAVTGPVASARVTVQSGSTIRTAYTSGTGAYTIGRLQPGTYSVTVTKLGYTFPAVPTSPVTVGLSSAGNDVQGTKP